MLQLDGDATAGKATSSSKYASLTGRPREEERLRVLEAKERNHSEELAVRSTFFHCALISLENLHVETGHSSPLG